MKQKNSLKVVCASGLMLIASFAIMWLALTFFGRLSGKPVQDDQKFLFNNNLIGVNITQQDYENYPALSASEIPAYMKNYILKPEDAAVLAAKQIEKITGINVAGLTADLALNAYDKCWEGSYLVQYADAETKYESYYMDAVSGELFAFSSGIEYLNIDFSEDEYLQCAQKALEIAKEQFPDRKDNIKVLEKTFEQINSLIVGIEIDVDRNAYYVFSRDEEKDLFISGFSTR